MAEGAKMAGASQGTAQQKGIHSEGSERREERLSRP